MVSSNYGRGFCYLQHFTSRNNHVIRVNMHIKRVGYLYNSINQTSEDVVVTVRYAVYTLQLSERDFFEANSSAKVVSKVRNVPKKIRKQNIRELFQTQPQTSL